MSARVCTYVQATMRVSIQVHARTHTHEAENPTFKNGDKKIRATASISQQLLAL
jgi:hypothetical protein